MVKLPVLLLLVTLAGHAIAQCDRTGSKSVLGVTNYWSWQHDPISSRQASFKNACADLRDCYGVLGRQRSSCERQFQRDLESACRKVYNLLPEALLQCEKAAETAFDFLHENGGATYRRAQRLTRAKQRTKERRRQ